MRDILWIDTETGGLSSEKHSVLSVALVATRGDQIIGEAEFQIRQEPIVADPIALQVNGIDINSPGLTHGEFQDAYWEKMMEWYYAEGYDEDKSPTIGGANTQFDLKFLRKALGERAEGFVLDPLIDVQKIAVEMKKKNLVNFESKKLESLCKACDVPIEIGDVYHTALGDVRQTFKLYQRLKAIAAGSL
jgi:DNA polymerase III epsilon subunit-like protein